MLKEAVRAIIQNEVNEALLVKRADGIEATKYCLPGGKVDSDETSEQAVIREIKEELGLSFNPVSSFVDFNSEWKTTYFIGETSGAIVIKQDEISEIIYVGKDSLDEIDIAFDHELILQKYFNFENEKR